MIVSKTPFRMSFVGGGSDLPAFYREEIGAVLSTSIDKYMYICINKKFDNRIRINYSRTEDVLGLCDVEHPIVREVLGMMNITGGIEIASMADIPSKGSGLGSSSAYTVGLLNALSAYTNKFISKESLASQACNVEIVRCLEPIGKQDQYAAAYGGLNLIRFYPDESVSVDPVICSPNIQNELESSILVFFTGLTRKAATVLANQSIAMKSPQARKLTRRMVGLAFEMKEQLESGTLDNFGELLNENWRLKSQLTSCISNSQIDRWYSIALKNGASGGKLLGAGNGGFLMFFAHPQHHGRIISALPELKLVKFGFERDGAQIAFYQPARGKF
jgi:D-glycero-alpha-D-manno-heptose-7-phosphate kinase